MIHSIFLQHQDLPLCVALLFFVCFSVAIQNLAPAGQNALDAKNLLNENLEKEGPVALFSLPDSFIGKILYVINFPVVLLIWASIPDIRKPGRSGLVWLLLSLLPAVIWTGGLCYVLTWMCLTIAHILGIPENGL